MDRVRFGRALGMGAREAARAVLKAADAAKAPSPEARQTANPVVQKTKAAPEVLRPERQVERPKVTVAGVKRGGKKFGEAMWGPFAKASSVLWLEVTGVLFGMFALVAGSWAWNNRLDLAAGGKPAHQEWVRLGMMALFGYLTVSSYVRAAQRSRR